MKFMFTIVILWTMQSAGATTDGSIKVLAEGTMPTKELSKKICRDQENHVHQLLEKDHGYYCGGEIQTSTEVKIFGNPTIEGSCDIDHLKQTSQHEISCHEIDKIGAGNFIKPTGKYIHFFIAAPDHNSPKPSEIDSRQFAAFEVEYEDLHGEKRRGYLQPVSADKDFSFFLAEHLNDSIHQVVYGH